MFPAGGPLLSALIHARLAKRRFGIIARKYTRAGAAPAQGKTLSTGVFRLYSRLGCVKIKATRKRCRMWNSKLRAVSWVTWTIVDSRNDLPSIVLPNQNNVIITTKVFSRISFYTKIPISPDILFRYRNLWPERFFLDLWFSTNLISIFWYIST